MHRTGRRVATVLVVAALVGAAGWGVIGISGDPVRARVTGWWPTADDADRGEVVVVEQIEDAMQQAGPYFGPDVDLGDVLVVSPAGYLYAEPTTDLGRWAVLRVQHRSTGPFRAEGEALVRMRFHPRNGLNGWTSGRVVERCRTVRVRCESGPPDVDTVRTACPT